MITVFKDRYPPGNMATLVAQARHLNTVHLISYLDGLAAGLAGDFALDDLEGDLAGGGGFSATNFSNRTL